MWIDEAPGGLLLTPDSTKEQQAAVLINLLSEEGMLEGKTVAVVADQDSEGRANDVIAPGLEEAGATLGSTAVLTITGEDTSQAQAQMDAFLEQWQSEDVDTIFMAGLIVSAKQFVQKIKDAMPDVQLMFDDDSTAQQAQDLVERGCEPESVRRIAEYRVAAPIPSRGTTRRRCSNSASTRTKPRPVRR